MRPASCRARCAALVSLLLLAATPRAALAAWPYDTGQNVPLQVATGYQEDPQVLSDGAGGALVVWHDNRSGNYDIYIERVSATGTALWTTPICVTTGTQMYPVPAADGAGGAIVAWHDSRSGNYDIYAQRVDKDGVVQWTANGVVVCNATGTQEVPAILGDGNGGSIIAWEDGRSGTDDVYAQRLSGSGTPQWTANGVAICTSANSQYYPQIASDGSDGAIIVWEDARGGNWDIYAQRVNASGVVQWTANGRTVCTEATDQYDPHLAGDGTGECIIVWYDNRNANYDIYAQNIDASGNGDWVANGVAICTQSNYQFGQQIVSDGGDGAIIAWDDNRTGTGYDVYAQHVNNAGSALWGSNGMAICTQALDQRNVAMVADGAGGAFLAWNDQRYGGQDIYAQHVNFAGDPRWAGGGVAVSSALGNQFWPVVAADGAGGLIAVWNDNRNTPSTDLYAQRVFARPVIARVRDVPNDQGGVVRLSWDASFLDTDYPSTVDQYLVWRQIPAAKASFGRGAFATTIQSGQTWYWELVDTITAAGMEGYSLAAATPCDSIAGSNPYTVFMIRARNSYTLHYWDSAPDSGYSVDNLPPETPAPFAGQYAAGSVALHWGRNSESDFALYRLHRGTTPWFIPAPGNLVTSQPDTGFVDHPGAPCYYKLCAVDAHGNLSSYAFLQPEGVLGVDGSGVPAEVWLARPAPNPARDGCVIRFGLPRTAPVRLAIFDQQGRRVRELVNASLPEGERAIRWDGRDASGRPLASGLYFARMDAEARSITRKIAVTR